MSVCSSCAAHEISLRSRDWLSEKRQPFGPERPLEATVTEKQNATGHHPDSRLATEATMTEEAPHGSFEQRGHKVVAKDRQAEGRFGLMFRKLPPFQPPDDLLRSLAATMEQPRPSPFTQFDNPDIPGGFTFLGQFVDHDITFDPKSDLEKQQDPDGLTNFRTPVFDLDSVYKGGPTASPQLYDGPRLRLDVHDGIEDLVRGSDGRADIGDPRNDENAIICQLQIAFIEFHNAVVEHVQASGGPTDELFARAQRLAQFHYQWAVLTDFLPHICGASVVDDVLKKPSGNAPVRAQLRFYKPRQVPYIPVEFSVGAYRFGHSQIRPAYRMNAQTVAAFFQPEAGETNLNGFRPLLPRLKIDWQHFFDVPGSPTSPQRSMRIDAKLSAPLFHLPFGGEPRSLALRNLLRGKALQLPSGQAVAAEMQRELGGVAPLTNQELGLTEPGWDNQAPLWFYVLKEAEVRAGSRRLGPVGARIVAEVIVGLLAENRSSFFTLDPTFRPDRPFTDQKGEFRMGDLLRFAGAV